MQQSANAGRLVLVACCLAQLVHSIYGSLVNVALPDIGRSLNADATDLQWIVTVYVLALASLLILSGTLADRFGRRLILVAGNVLMVVGAVICATSPNPEAMILGRALQGVGSALIAPAGLSILTTDLPDGPRRSAAIIWWTLIGTAALSAGPSIGGLLVRGFGWEAIFWGGVPVGLAAIALTLLYVPESKADKPRPFDGLGQLLVTIVLAASAFALVEGGLGSWTSTPVILSGVAVVVALPLLVVHAQRASSPLIPPALFRDRPFTIALATAVFGYGAAAGLLLAAPTALSVGRGLGAAQVGLAMVPLAIGAVVTSWQVRRVIARAGSSMTLVISGILIAASSVLLIATQSVPLWGTLGALFLFGLGFGLIADPVSVRALSELPESDAGLASSVISTSKQVGQMLGLALAGILLAAAARNRGGSAADALAETDSVWLLLACCGAAIAFLNANIRKERPATSAR